MEEVKIILVRSKQLADALEEQMRYQTNWAAIGLTGAQFGTYFVQGERHNDMSKLISTLGCELQSLKMKLVNSSMKFDLIEFDKVTGPFISYDVVTWFKYQQNKKVRIAVKKLKKYLTDLVIDSASR